jgi:hypothetical protein
MRSDGPRGRFRQRSARRGALSLASRHPDAFCRSRQGGIVARPLPLLDPLDSAREVRVRARRSGAARAPVSAARAEVDPDHHLWRNGRLWWVAFTIHRGHLQERVRHSLGTPDLVEARWRRDEVLRRQAEAGEGRLSLRFEGRRRRHRPAAREASHE